VSGEVRAGGLNLSSFLPDSGVDAVKVSSFDEDYFAFEFGAMVFIKINS
jgi:hypothetical protein